MNSSADTIAALSTPRGRGAIAIIRLSGPEALRVAQTFWHGQKPAEHLDPRRLYGGWIAPNGRKLDSALITTSHAPRSYTGEDMVELHTHGSPAVIDEVMKACLSAGARLAEPGEFTKRALLNGKLDAAQAEAVADLVEAESSKLARLAADQLAGGLSRKMAALVDAIVSLAAAEAAHLDFSEEDISEQTYTTLLHKAEAAEAELTELISYSRNISVLRDGVSVALVGLPNAGKSTLLNKLLGFERSIVTDVAGTTRDTIEERVILGDIPFRITDTAGLNTNPDEIEAIGIERTHAAVAAADVVLVLVAPGSWTETKAYLEKADLAADLAAKHTLLVATKADVATDELPKPSWANEIVQISAKTSKGLDDLREALVRSADIQEVGGDVVLTTQRQLELVVSARDHIKQAIVLLQSGTPRDIVLVELESAAKQLTRITGADTNDAMISDMFSRFCIGK